VVGDKHQFAIDPNGFQCRPHLPKLPVDLRIRENFFYRNVWIASPSSIYSIGRFQGTSVEMPPACLI